MERENPIIGRLSSALNYVSYAAVAGLMLLVTLNVILRAAFKSPILGTYDYSGFLTIAIIGCGLSRCFLDDGHIEIGYFTEKFNRKARKVIVVSGRTLSALMLFLTSYSMFTYALRLMKTNEVSMTTKTPVSIFAFLLSFCFLVFAFTVIARLIDSSRKGEER